MKHLPVILLLSSLVVAGCQQPSEVKLNPADPDQELTVSSVVEPDTNEPSTPDSTGLVVKDRNQFAGSLLVTSVKYDNGLGVATVSAATAVLEDRTKPPILTASGKIAGYPGIFLGNSLKLNGVTMIRVTRMLAGVFAGWKYVGDLSLTYRPNQPYRWVAPADPVGGIEDSIDSPIDSPDDLTVFSPHGGGVFSRNHDLELRWKGQGTISIIIQAYEPLAKKTKPLLLITPKTNRGRAILGTKLLALLPRGRNFVFTFVLANRRELTLPRYSGVVLIQAASIYNSFVVIN